MPWLLPGIMHNIWRQQVHSDDWILMPIKAVFLLRDIKASSKRQIHDRLHDRYNVQFDCCVKWMSFLSHDDVTTGFLGQAGARSRR